MRTLKSALAIKRKRRGGKLTEKQRDAVKREVERRKRNLGAIEAAMKAFLAEYDVPDTPALPFEHRWK